MEDYLDEMLHLTADIAEELLTIKDTGNQLNDHTAEQIARLAELAFTYRMENPDEAPEAAHKPQEAAYTVSEAAYEPRESAYTASEAPAEAHETWGEPMAEVEAEEGQALTEQALEHEQAYDVAPVETAFAEERESEQEAMNAIAQEEADAEVELPDTAATAPGISETEASETEMPEAQSARPADAEQEPIADVEAGAPIPDYNPAMTKMPLFTSRDLRNAFTLNDVFLFQRTLFHGSSAEFKAALEEITTFSSVDELKDYLASIHHVDLKSPEAEQFVGIVDTFFR